MSKRKKDQGGGLGTLLVCLIVVLAYVVAVGGLLLVLGWIGYSYFKWTTLGVSDLSQLAPCADEVSQVQGLMAVRDQCDQKLKELHHRGEEAHIRIRNDGKFDERSYLGYELNQQIAIHEDIRSQSLHELSSMRAEIRGRMRAWIEIRSRCTAAVNGAVAICVVWPLTFVIVSLKYEVGSASSAIWACFITTILVIAVIFLYKKSVETSLESSEAFRAGERLGI